MKTIANCGISKRLSGLSLSVSMSMSLLFFALLYGGNTFSVQAHSYDFSHNASGEAQQVSSPGPEPTVTIAFGDLTWPSALLQTRIAQYIAEMGYGYATTVEASSPQPLFRALRAGDIDVLMELWLPHQEVDWEEALTEGDVYSPGKSLGTDWQSAFVVPKYLQEQYPDLVNVEDLKEEKFRSLFATDETDGKARLVSCVAGLPCEVVNAKQIQGYGLSDHVHIVNPASLNALNADLEEAYENRDPWLGYQWGTNKTALQLDLVRLEEPEYSDQCWATTMACAYEESTALIAINLVLSDTAANFVDVLTEWDFNVEEVYKPVVQWQTDNPNTNTEDAALWWLRENDDVWSEWVTADAGTAIQDSLDNGSIPKGWPDRPSITPELTPTPGPSPEPTADECVGTVSGNGTITGSWSSDCASEGRSGSYARFYTFTLDEPRDVAITLESEVDTYLYVREGEGTDGRIVYEDDDDDNSVFSLASSTDSGISESLGAGVYTIEATTVTPGETGEFTLTIRGVTGAYDALFNRYDTDGDGQINKPEVIAAVRDYLGGQITKAQVVEVIRHYIIGPPTPAPPVDRAALVALYNATDGPNWTNNHNWLSEAPIGEWYGVTTDDDGRVTQIRLWENNLIGSIPADLGNLTSLQRLGLWSNDLSGEIPSELGNLSSLERMSLDDNQLSGGIPSELGSLSNLERIFLHGNQLSGEIPSELGNLSSLERMSLDDNQLSGGIPSELGNLSNLERLYLTRNQLSGEIPTELSSLPNLEELALGGNQLSGSIPAELGSLASLIELYLWGNEFSGEIPSELGGLPSLQRLGLWSNDLSGEIPSELGNLSSLERMSLDDNQLSGMIPSELGNLTELTGLYLFGNQLSGEIPSELGNLSSLERMSLEDNQLSGKIPAELGSLANLQYLGLTRNQLSGEIPTELSSLPNLEELALGGNQLSGGIPTELGRLTELTGLYLWGNQLSGEIPSELGSLSNISVLSLLGNELTGEIPSKLASLSSLEVLALSYNQLTGGISSELGSLVSLTRLYLNNNELSGEIPSEFGRLSNLNSLLLEENQLSGEIPSELLALLDLEIMTLWGNQFHGDVLTHSSDRNVLTSLYNATSGAGWTDNAHWLTNEPVFTWYGVGIDTNGHVTALLLEDNQLTGEMPSELGSLSSLIWLNLSRNQLSGEIPPELGNLSNLEWLSLVENELSGCVPSELINVEFNDLDDLGLPLCSDRN